MKVLLIGGGGRENALALSCVASNSSLYSISHNYNPGIMGLSKKHFISDENHKEEILKIAEKIKPELVLIGPEDPLSNGVADILISQKFNVFAPTSKAAKLETSKSFLRQFMNLHRIDGNVESHAFSNFNDLREHLKSVDYEFVLKPDGLTGGKGVLVQGQHFLNRDEALKIAEKLFKNGINKLLVEKKLLGEEFSLQGLVKDDFIVFYPIVQDYKRALEGDKGPNTGGMGSISFSEAGLPFIPEEHVEKAKKILSEIISNMYKDSEPYIGPIYGQFMSTSEGPKLIEVNARFGDPEAINVLDLSDDSIVDLALELLNGQKPRMHFKDQFNVVRYIVPKGYGMDPSPSKLMVDEISLRRKGLKIYYASVDKKGKYLIQSRSRSLALLARGSSLDEINERFENIEDAISGDFYYRGDIGSYESIEHKKKYMESILKRS